MTLRRKHSPSPIAKADATSARHVVAATARTFALPTVAALLACAAIACSAPNGSTDGVQADPMRKPIATNANGTTTITTTSTSTIGSKPIVDPDPEVHAVKGEIAPVKPRPKPMPSTLSTVAPTSKPPHLGGADAIVDPQ